MREPPRRRRLDPVVDAFVLDCRARNLSPRTVEFYLEGINALRRTLPAPPAEQTMAMLDLEAARNLAAAMGDRVAPSTAAGRIRALKIFARWCVRERYLGANPLERLATPRVPRTEIACFSDAQVGQLLRSASRELRLALELLLDTGLRISELVALRVGDVRPGMLWVVGKGGHERTVPLGRNAERALRRELERRGPARSDEALLRQHSGRPQTAAAIALGMRRLAQRLEMSGVRVSPHTCRHTFATAFLVNGGSLLALQQILGHRDLAMVRRYVQLSPAQLVEQQLSASPLDRWTSARLLTTRRGHGDAGAD